MATRTADAMPHQWVYRFGGGMTEGDASMGALLGGKGANLAEMSAIGLPVPPGFTITTEVCAAYSADDGAGKGAGEDVWPDGLREQVADAVKALGDVMGAGFGDTKNPLLVAVRSGARVSMPGMMDTVLNLGLNDESAAALAGRTGDGRFAWDSYRRFVQMYGDVVLGIEHFEFEDILEQHKIGNGYVHDTDLNAADWQDVTSMFLEKVEKETGAPFPQGPETQLWGAIAAVFGSWMNRRAVTYRALHGISDDIGTAVNVQAMVFGNMGDDCATGVAFTRDPATGENIFYGEYLINAQGEDVVAGIRTPQNITVGEKQANDSDLPAMEEAMPDIFAELMAVRGTLESHFRDVQDIEFTVQKGRLWMLQTRSGKRTAKAALRIACEMVGEGLITREEAIMRIQPDSLDQLLHPTLDPAAERHLLTTGLPASPGAASGLVVFEADEAELRAGRGEDVILVRAETSPEDIGGMHAARGILTARGGMTSHAAVVARGMGTPCVAGAGELAIDYVTASFTVRGETVHAGEVITIDGASGEVMAGAVPTRPAELSGEFATLMGWVGEIAAIGVRANAETPEDARAAVRFGVDGIGLSRTEHMFFDAERINAVREMILAGDEAGRRIALAKLLPMQRDDFAELFRIMAGRPITIRLLDPPLHEFLPRTESDMAELAETLGTTAEAVRLRAVALHEANPMLGHRGCRLAITYPEISEMQARAIFEAQAQVIAEGIAVASEIMIPLIATKREFDILKATVDRVAVEVGREKGVELGYITGTMIELPRACLRAGEIAETAEFFSFGTNDLTQTVFGLSRDDAGSFLADYQRAGIFAHDPFVTIDEEGVGEMMKIAIERGRATRPGIKLGICGEHGGDPKSVAFCHRIGLDYVSCSPYRVPIARLAAAQAALNETAAQAEKES
jgi:pyruvate,orthophosphate dikinase